MRGIAWASVAEMEPKLHRMEAFIEHTLPSKLQKIQGHLEPAQQKVEELEKQYQDQVCCSGSNQSISSWDCAVLLYACNSAYSAASGDLLLVTCCWSLFP